MSKLYPEIYNLIIKVENEPVISKPVVKNTARVKKEEPAAVLQSKTEQPSVAVPGFFNF